MNSTMLDAQSRKVGSMKTTGSQQPRKSQSIQNCLPTDSVNSVNSGDSVHSLHSVDSVTKKRMVAVVRETLPTNEEDDNIGPKIFALTQQA